MPESSEGQAEYRDGAATAAHYLSVVAHRVRLLMEKVETSIGRQRGSAASSSAVLADVLLRILSRFFDRLLILNLAIDAQPVDDIIREAHTIHVVLATIVPELVHALRRSDLSSPLAPVVEAYEHLGHEIKYGARVILYATWEHNARIAEIMDSLRTMTRVLGKDTGEAVFSGAPQKFVIVGYPAAERELVLGQAILAHEFGHFIGQESDWLQSLFERPILDDKGMANLLAVIEQLSASDEDEREALWKRSRLLAGEMVAAWVGEIVADLLAQCLLGPAFLLALDDTTFSPRSPGTRQLSRTHPPGELRRELIGELARKLHLNPDVVELVNQKLGPRQQHVLARVRDWVDDVSKPRTLRFASVEGAKVGSEVATALYSVLEKSLRGVVSLVGEEYIKEIKDRPWFCTNEDIMDALELEELVSCGLPPAELLSDPDRLPSFAAIMNAGWFHFLFNEGEYLYFAGDAASSERDDAWDRYVRLQNLVSKAIENLHFKREFRRRFGQDSE